MNIRPTVLTGGLCPSLSSRIRAAPEDYTGPFTTQVLSLNAREPLTNRLPRT